MDVLGPPLVPHISVYISLKSFAETYFYFLDLSNETHSKLTVDFPSIVLGYGPRRGGGFPQDDHFLRHDPVRRQTAEPTEDSGPGVARYTKD